MSSTTDIGQKAGEMAAEVVEETVDGVVDVVEVFRTNPQLLAVAGGAGLLIGATVGYFVASKKLKAIYEEISSTEIAEARTFYAGLNKVSVDGEPLTPQEIYDAKHGEGAAAAAAAMRQYRGEAPEQVDEEDEGQLALIESRVTKKVQVEEDDHGTFVVDLKTERNVFADDNFDYDEEKKYRTSDEPYVITFDEFFEGEGDFDQTRVVYYEADDTIAGEDDKAYDDIEGTVGTNNLVRFGSGSKDRNVVYVRNEKLKVDYEVTKSPGSYLEEVLGVPLDEPDSSGDG